MSRAAFAYRFFSLPTEQTLPFKRKKSALRVESFWTNLGCGSKEHYFIM